MSKRFIIKYLYKGKVFSVAFSEGSTNKHFLIGNKLTIGSDPYLLWQIFNPTFPKKHDLIINENGNYYVSLLKTFSIEVNKGNQKLGIDELKSLGLLKDNRLYMKEDYEGSIFIDENTTIKFQSIPIAAPLSSEQKKTIALLSRWPQVSAQQNVTRYSIISVILFIIIFASIIGWTYTPPREQNIFDRTEANTIVSMQVQAPVDVAPTETEYYDETEVDEEGDIESDKVAQQEAQARATAQNVNARMAERSQARRSSTPERYNRGAGGGGGNGQTGTGTALAVTNRVRGLKGTSRANSSFSGIDVDTGSEYGEIAASLNRQQNDQLNTAAVSARGVSADRVRGRRTTGIGSAGDTDLGSLASDLGDGYGDVQTVASTDIDDTNLGRQGIEGRVRVKKDLTDSEKELQINEWFKNVLLVQINQEYDRYKLRKTIRGRLIFTLIFKQDKIVRANIKGTGSINDKEFITKLRSIIENRTYQNIGNYTINITQSFD